MRYAFFLYQLQTFFSSEAARQYGTFDVKKNNNFQFLLSSNMNHRLGALPSVRRNSRETRVTFGTCELDLSYDVCCACFDELVAYLHFINSFLMLYGSIKGAVL